MRSRAATTVLALILAVPDRLGGAVAWAAAAFLAERDRWALWLPVFLGAGIGVYFALPVEPAGWVGPAALAAAALALAVGRHRPAMSVLGLCAAAAAAGFAVAQIRTASVAAPVLQRDLGPVWVVGRIVELEQGASRVRLVLERLEIARLDPTATPARIRVSSAGSGTGALRPGAWVQGTMVLRPPPEPSAPGGYDFARRAWFERLGAVGFTLGPPQLAPPQPGWPVSSRRFEAWWLFWEGLRQTISERILAVLPDERGALAVALTVGKREAIPPDLLDAMRDSGLAHLLAISGLHLGLIAGAVFVGLRSLLALWPAVALRRPIKKWAAGCALAVAFVYLFLAGATIPTQRAFLMVELVFLAVMLDRSAVSLRLVAWAAAAVLLIAPESLLSASFQMSFAAVIALVAGYEAYAAWRAGRDRAPGADGGRPLWLRPVTYLGGVALSSVIAVVATGTYAWYHFNRLAWFGLTANLVAVPLTALWVMPAALFALLLMPLGLEEIPLWAMGQGLAILIWVARETASWPGAVQLLPALPAWGLTLISLGGLWLCLWRRLWRLAGVAVILAGMSGALWREPPDLMISADGGLIAARGPDERLALSQTARETFVWEQWLRRSAQAEPAPWPPPGDWLACDAAGCIYRRYGWTVALVSDAAALGEDCALADLVIAPIPVPAACGRSREGPQRVVDRYRLWRDGGHALVLRPDRIEIATVREDRGDRPWVRNRMED